MTTDDSQHLLEILQAHGEQFSKSFNTRDLPARSIDRRRRDHNLSEVDAEEEEWQGIIIEVDTEIEETQNEDEDYAQEDHQFIADSNREKSNVVVFNDVIHSNASLPVSKAGKKKFMSSNIAKLRRGSPKLGLGHKISEADNKERITNAQNDAVLHRLIHTKLLSGSLSTELDLTPAQRQKALAGRVLELSGDAKLGKGEKFVQDQERNRASKPVREGLLRKQNERQKRDLEQAKDMGNYHPKIKRVFDSSDIRTRKRARGIGMGIGKFRHGLLTLSRKDITRVQDEALGRDHFKGQRKQQMQHRS